MEIHLGQHHRLEDLGRQCVDTFPRMLEQKSHLTILSIVILYTGANGPLYGFSLFLPSIINELGKSMHETARKTDV